MQSRRHQTPCKAQDSHRNLMRKPWKFGLSSSQPTTWAMRPCCPSGSTRSRLIRRSPASLLMGPTTRASATTPSPNEVLPPSFAPQECETLESRHCGCSCAQRGITGIEIPRPRALATMERLPPQEPCRNENALCETVGSAPQGAGLRSPGRGVPSACGRAERLHRARHPRHKGRGISLSGRRGQSARQPICETEPI